MKRLRRLLYFALAFGVVAVCAALLVLQSSWLRNQVRQRIISEAENATGGRVEIGDFSYDWRSLTARVSPFVLHGKEASSAPPLFHADAITLKLKIVSVIDKKLDLQTVDIDVPRVRLTVTADGRSNLPEPKVRSRQDALSLLLDLKARRISLHNGYLDYNEGRIPLDFSADSVEAALGFTNRNGRAYSGTVTARQVSAANGPFAGPLSTALKASVQLRRDGIDISSGLLSRGASQVQFTGRIENWAAPRGNFNAHAHLYPRDLDSAFHLAAFMRDGQADYDGQVSFTTFPFTYAFNGNVKARTPSLTLASHLDASAGSLRLTQAHLTALGGSFNGVIQLSPPRALSLEGEASAFPLDQIAKLTNQNLGGLSGAVSGPVHATAQLTPAGIDGLVVTAKAHLTPAPGALSIQGSLDFNYNQRAHTLSINPSQLSIGTTTATLSGALGQNLEAHVQSANLNDVLSVLRLINPGAPVPTLPIELHGGGFARFDGGIQGAGAATHIRGTLQLTRFRYQDQDFDSLTAPIDVSSAQLAFGPAATVQQKDVRAETAGALALSSWTASRASRINATVAVRNAELSRLLSTPAQPSHVHGLANASLEVTGTLESPDLTGSLEAPALEVFSEPAQNATLNFHYRNGAFDVTSGSAKLAAGTLHFTANYAHNAGDWRTGELRFNGQAASLQLGLLHVVNEYREGVRGRVDGRASGQARLENGAFSLESLNSKIESQPISLDGKPYGNIVVNAATNGEKLTVEAKANLRGTPLTGSGVWQLSGQQPGQAQIDIPRITVAALHDLAPGTRARAELPFDGYVQGQVHIEAPLRDLEHLHAEAVFSAIQINPVPTSKSSAALQAADLTVRNSAPVILDADLHRVTIRSADFSAKNTTVRATGGFALDSKAPWDLHLTGAVNLAVLRLFNPDLLGAGSSVLNVTLKGPFLDPLVDGRLELKNASLFLRDVPTGVDQANGTVRFDSNRATVESLNAVIGGGTVAFQPGSFIGFRGDTVTYRVQAQASNVRYRTIEGLSVTADAALSLAGSSENSLLSGTLTVDRAALSPRTDIGNLLTTLGRPLSVGPSSNEYLRGLNFDIRVLSSASLQLQTFLTHDVQAEANLRIRGNLVRPSVLGRVTVDSGAIDFFGTKYTITHGEVNFLNAARIEPVVNMDLETKVRGITVDIRFAGPLNKLNFSYRSDPPFESSQIIALLAVGRVPNATVGLASAQTGSNNFLSTGNNPLVAQVVTPENGRLQRFFGVSHIKIDPQFTDITATPQARLTVEQQLSKEVTVTYITNLQRTQEQLIRAEWDLTPTWSAVMLRDENGAFGIDFQYRKRFR